MATYLGEGAHLRKCGIIIYFHFESFFIYLFIHSFIQLYIFIYLFVCLFIYLFGLNRALHCNETLKETPLQYITLHYRTLVANFSTKAQFTQKHDRVILWYGSVFQALTPFILKDPWYFWILDNGGRSWVNSLLTDTLVSGQLYLRTCFRIPVLSPSQTLYLYIPVSGHSHKRTANDVCL